MIINERVRLLRKTLGLTQKDFGKRISVAQTYLSQIEKGERDVTDKIFRLICLEFDVSESWLRNGDGEMFAPIGRDDEIAAWSATVLSPENDETFMRSFTHVLTKLTKDDWKSLQHIAELMLEENEKKAEH